MLVGEWVGVAVAAGVSVGSGVAVGEGTGVAVGVGETVGVAVGVAVAVGVGVGTSMVKCSRMRASPPSVLRTMSSSVTGPLETSRKSHSASLSGSSMGESLRSIRFHETGSRPLP